MQIFNLVTGPISTNTWLLPLRGDCIAVIDPGGNPEKIIAQISLLGRKPYAVLLTHGHFDHLAALPALCETYPGLKTGISRADAVYLGKQAAEEHLRILGDEADFLYPNDPQWMLRLPEPDFFLDEGPMPAIPGEEGYWEGWEVLATPGHTPGSVCLYHPQEKLLFAGDTLFFQGCGRTDLPDGNPADMEASLHKLSALPRETQVMPGHGRKTRIGAEFP